MLWWIVGAIGLLVVVATVLIVFVARRRQSGGYDRGFGSSASEFMCKRCRKATDHSSYTDQYAGRLWVCVSCGYKTPRFN
jgi:predicted RNA-binding Zn-ribbon protein involved in translation (DUF1610 family)